MTPRTVTPALPAEESQRDAVAFSIIVPVYNEAATLSQVLPELLEYSDQYNSGVEVIVVNDGSSDRSQAVAESFIPRIKLLAHAYNRGYGSALVTGAEAARGHVLVFFDADGQHTVENLKAILNPGTCYDMVVGARQRHEAPLVRNLGRRLIHALASYLVDFPIPDLNSGLRLVDRSKFLAERHLYPHGFSLSSTLTLAFLKRGYSVSFVPIAIRPRQAGKSAVRLSRDGTLTIGLVVRLIMLFAPLKIFLPIAGIQFFLGAASFAVELVWTRNIGENTALLLISSLLVFLFGLLADQVAAIRRELRSR